MAVTWRQVSAFRLERHHLIARAPKGSLVRVAGDMTGAQAQVLSAAQLALGSRISDATVADVEKAVAARRLVRVACMRRTLFLVPARDVAKYVRGSARRADREIHWARGKGVPDKAIQAAIEAALDTLDEPLTRPEIADKVSRKLGVQRKNVHGGGWGRRSKIAAVPVGHLVYPVVDLLHLVGSRGVVCYGPNRGGEPTFVRADAWLPAWKDLPQEAAETALLRSYLAAFGPSTVAGFAFWAGLNLAHARLIWSREQAHIAPVDLAGAPAFVLRKDLDALIASEMPRNVVRLLPFFDSFLLGHRERGHLLDPKHYLKVYRPQGWVSPVLLINGRVAGMWEHSLRGEKLHVRIQGFQKVPAALVGRIRAEAQHVARFVGAPQLALQIA